MIHSYTAIIERVGDSWNAYVPDLPGCIAAADTQARVTELIREAIPAHVQLLRERGEAVPSPVTETTRVPVAV